MLQYHCKYIHFRLNNQKKTQKKNLQTSLHYIDLDWSWNTEMLPMPRKSMESVC